MITSITNTIKDQAMDRAKAERFRRVAAPRVQKVLDSLDNLAKCANKNNYEYTTAEVSKMIRAIKTKVKTLEQRFGEKTGSTNRDRFEF